MSTLAALGFAPSTAEPSLFLRTDTSLPPFYFLVYVNDLVFATADTEALTLVKSELQKRHTCTDLGELRSYLGLHITWDRARRTITLTQSHMVHQVLQRFGFQFSSPQPTPLSTGHSLSAPPWDESVEPIGPYPELVGCLITSGMGLVLGGRGPVVLTGHADASWVDDSAMQRSSQGARRVKLMLAELQQVESATQAPDSTTSSPCRQHHRSHPLRPPLSLLSTMDAISRPPAAPLSARRWVVGHKKWAPPAAAPPPASASFASSLADSFLPSHAHSSYVPSHPSLVSSHPLHGGSWANGSVVDGSCGLEGSQRGRADESWSGARNIGARHDGDAAVPGGAHADAGWRKRKRYCACYLPCRSAFLVCVANCSQRRLLVVTPSFLLTTLSPSHFSPFPFPYLRVSCSHPSHSSPIPPSPFPPLCTPFPPLPFFPSPGPLPPPRPLVPSPSPASPASSHLSSTADDSACLTSSHGPHAPPSALPHAAVAPSHADSPFAHPSASPPAQATRWDVPLFSAKRACLAGVQRRPAERAAWAESPGAWGAGPAAFEAQGREAAAAAAAVAGKAEGRGGAWRALSASSVDFAPHPFQPIAESDLLLEASGGGAPLAFAVGAAAGAHGDGRGGIHHPASSVRSIGGSMESGARTRRVVCARGRKRRGAGGDPGQQVAMARRAGDGAALIEAGGWAAAQGEGEQSSCAYGGERTNAEGGDRPEEEAERREGGGVGAESTVRPRRRRRKVGLVGVAEEGKAAEERDGLASSARRPPSAHAPVLAGCAAAGTAGGGPAGSASVDDGLRAGGAASAGTCAPSPAECRAREGSSRDSSGGSSACERESTGSEQRGSEQRAGRRRSARVLQDTVNGARGEGLRDYDGEARCCADDCGDTRQRQRQRQRPNGTAGEAGGAGGAGAEADEEAEMRRRFSVVVQSQVVGSEEEDGPLEGDADRSMSEHVGAAKFVLSSGRTLSAEGLPAPKKKPTIDDEFEQYFAQLLL
ncbi:unnamed protein product [Closterium sp. NIES-54]